MLELNWLFIFIACFRSFARFSRLSLFVSFFYEDMHYCGKKAPSLTNNVETKWKKQTIKLLDFFYFVFAKRTKKDKRKKCKKKYDKKGRIQAIRTINEVLNKKKTARISLFSCFYKNIMCLCCLVTCIHWELSIVNMSLWCNGKQRHHRLYNVLNMRQAKSNHIYPFQSIRIVRKRLQWWATRINMAHSTLLLLTIAIQLNEQQQKRQFDEIVEVTHEQQLQQQQQR